jgi:hypothetical protein
MGSNRLSWIDDAWLWVKRLALQWAIWGFVLSTILSFSVVAVQLGADALNWLKTGTWGNARTIADVWPAMADYVAALKWVGVQRIGLWIIAKSVVWAYLAFGVVSFVICGFFVEVHDSFEQRWRWRRSAPRHHMSNEN